ncbi:MAG: beta-lactamase family protein, partial [Sphingomonas bacterium]|nr:beta-lactamase family protein [Sphingomonas bacterium]
MASTDWGMHMRRLVGLVAGTAAMIASPAAAVLPSKARVATLAGEAMASTGAKGLAIALIDNGRVVSVQAFGARNAKGDPLTPDTVMYGASLTKAVFGYYALMLVDEGKLRLDRPVAAMLPKPLPDYGNLDASGNWGDLAGDERWNRVTARHVLTHATGFANFAFIEPDGKLKFHFDPGARYAYSGEGIILLQFALEKGLGINVGADVQRRIFTPLGMTNTSLMWRPDFARNLADGWEADGKVEPHDERSRVRAAGSMDTSISDMAKFAAAMVRGWGLKPATRKAYAAPQLAITSRQQFPTLLPEALPKD